MRKGVIDHQMIHISVLDAGLRKRLFSRCAKSAGSSEVGHLADHRRFNTFTCTQNVYRFVRKISGSVCAGQDQRAAPVSHQTTLKLGKRISNHTIIHDLLNGQRIAVGGPRIQTGPLSLNHRDHGQLLKSCACFLHIPQERDREYRRWSHEPIRRLELSRQARPAAATSKAATSHIRSAALAMGNEYGMTQTLVNSRRRMTHMEHEGATTDGSTIHPGRHDTHIVRQISG